MQENFGNQRLEELLRSPLKYSCAGNLRESAEIREIQYWPSSVSVIRGIGQIVLHHSQLALMSGKKVLNDQQNPKSFLLRWIRL